MHDMTTSSPWLVILNRKEVNSMNYTKPEMVVLGDASLLIEGSKQGRPDPVTGEEIGLLDCETDD